MVWGRKLLEGIKAFYKENACVWVKLRKLCNSSGYETGHIMSTWLFYILKDGCMRVMKTKVENFGARLRLNGVT